DVVIIDEAQRVPGIGLSLKLLVDAQTPVKIIVTGSSSFELSGQVGEPLTGRKISLRLFPISQSELRQSMSTFELKENLVAYLRFGSYPEVLTAGSEARRIAILQEILGSYLLKDILELERVKSSKVLLDLLRLIAFQVGSEVSHRELATSLGIDAKTVARYLDLFEKAFVLFNVRGYSRNLRKEISKKSKYYFYDNGVRNAVISNFNRIDERDDIGILWENFLFVERMKRTEYKRTPGNIFFWRTWDGQEVDHVEEREGKLFGYEFKWTPKLLAPPRDWIVTYSNAEYQVIDRDNYFDFVL
ncbi:MAG: ATP-binding protein, partial [Spirochaetia bacterium]